nr:multicopper oxidase domain-containing protein [Kurthia senegalensis]
MKLKWTMAIVATSVLLTACNQAQTEKENTNSKETHSMMHTKQNGAMDHEQKKLQNNTGENTLTFPAVLQPDAKKGNHVTYTITAQTGKSELFKGHQTETFGYNGSLLGQTLRLEEGQDVTIHLKNKLKEATTFHWHGLEVSGDADGGPHKLIEAGGEQTIHFKVTQQAATLWYHPHPMGNTAQQVYKGLAGLLYIDDMKSKALDIPKTYGEDDFPIILQDRTFTKDQQLVYKDVANIDGTYGDTMMINGVVNAALHTDKKLVRLRILNGSNARNYHVHFDQNIAFTQIATDGGFLETPKKMSDLLLGAGERAEILVDFSKVKGNSLNLVDQDGTVLMPIQLSKNVVTSSATTKLNTINTDEKLYEQEASKVVKMEGMGENVTINGQKFDENRIDFTQKQGATEVWEIENAITDEGGMIHPFHIHGTQFQVLSINGEKPEASLQGYKDTITLQPGQKAKIAVTFPYKGTYMFHCHILEHEDNGMMGQIQVK